MSFLNDVRVIGAKETLHIRRDVSTLFFALVLPMVQLSLFGFAINFDVRHIRTVVVDLDRSPESRHYLQELESTENLQIVGYLDSTDQAADAIRRTDARVAVVVPPDFARRLGSALRPEVGVLIDGADSQVSNPARLAVLRPDPEGSAVDARVDLLYNPRNRTEIYTIPGLLGVILQLVTVALTAFSLVREREQGTLEQLMVTPVGRLALMLGKMAPYFALGMTELVVVIAVSRLVFGIPVAGSFWLLLLLSVPFVLGGLALGLVISTISRSQAHAMQLVQLTLLPSILLSGYLSPRETLPAPLHALSNMLPVTYFIQITRGIMVRGAGWPDLRWSALCLCSLTILLIAFATLRFRKSSG